MRVINITKLVIIIGCAGCFFVSNALARGRAQEKPTQIWVDESTQRVMIGDKGVKEYAFITIDDILTDPLAVRDSNSDEPDPSAYPAARSDNGEHALWYFAEYLRTGQLDKTVTCVREYIGNEDIGNEEKEEALMQIYRDLVGGDTTIKIMDEELESAEDLEGLTFDGGYYGQNTNSGEASWLHDVQVAGGILGEVVWNSLALTFPADAQPLE